MDPVSPRMFTAFGGLALAATVFAVLAGTPLAIFTDGLLAHIGCGLLQIASVLVIVGAGLFFAGLKLWSHYDREQEALL